MKIRYVVAVTFLAACSVQEPTSNLASTDTNPTSNSASGDPLLGIGFGRLVTVEAEATVDGTHKGDKEALLRVLRINGERAPAGTVIPWTYGGWFAERAFTSGHGGFLVQPGQVYMLRGYETGSWMGSPADVSSVLMDEFGPPQGKGFHFRSVFRVIDGSTLTRGSMGADHDK